MFNLLLSEIVPLCIRCSAAIYLPITPILFQEAHSLNGALSILARIIKNQLNNEILYLIRQNNSPKKKVCIY